MRCGVPGGQPMYTISFDSTRKDLAISIPEKILHSPIFPPDPSLIDVQLPTSSRGSMTSRRTPNGILKRNAISDLASLVDKTKEAESNLKRNTLTMSDLLALNYDPILPRTRQSLRHRSRSDSRVSTRRSLLARSHAALSEETLSTTLEAKQLQD